MQVAEKKEGRSNIFRSIVMRHEADRSKDESAADEESPLLAQRNTGPFGLPLNGLKMMLVVILAFAIFKSLCSLLRSLQINHGSQVSMHPHEAGARPSEKDLHDLWAAGYEGWVDVPGEAVGTIYFQPHKQGVSPPPSTKELPKLFTENPDAVLFSITAYNPLGAQLAKQENLRRNQQLTQVLDTMAPQPLHKWHSFGFSKNWREDGFTMAFKAEDAAAAETIVLDLAKQFKQGGIYKLFLRDSRLMRVTVPAAFSSNTVAETVSLVRIDEPSEVPKP